MIVRFMSKSKEMQMPIFNATYKGIPIKSDSRVHVAVLDILRNCLSPISTLKTINILDVATGRGSLAQRVIDSFSNIVIDCNDLEDGVLAKGARRISSLDLNFDFNFEEKYDVVLAIEVIEHLENPFHFIRMLQKHLKPRGFILVTTPNVDSFFDRLWFLFFGYSFYFGARGIVNSGGHITMCPVWLLRHIAESQNLELEVIPNTIDSKSLLGFKGRTLLSLLSPLKLLLKDVNDQSSTICIFRNKNISADNQ